MIYVYLFCCFQSVTVPILLFPNDVVTRILMYVDIRLLHMIVSCNRRLIGIVYKAEFWKQKTRQHVVDSRCPSFCSVCEWFREMVNAMSFREADKFLLWLASYSPRLVLFYTNSSMSMLGVMGWRPEYFMEIRKTHYRKCVHYRRLRDTFGDHVDCPTSRYYPTQITLRGEDKCDLCTTMFGLSLKRKYAVLGIGTNHITREYPWEEEEDS